MVTTSYILHLSIVTHILLQDLTNKLPEAYNNIIKSLKHMISTT